VLISIVGAGYVGLVTAACLAGMGNVVRCVDSSADRVRGLLAGEMPFEEAGLDNLVRAEVGRGRLSFHLEPSALHGTELAIIAVGTLDTVGEWTGRAVHDAVLAVARDRRGPRLLAIRSTLMPGTLVSLAGETGGLGVELGHNPEFTREGSAVADFLNPERVVVGVEQPTRPSALVEALRRLYEPLGAPLLVTDMTTAETIKVASNVFLATKVAFANEVARLCAATGADVATVVDGMGLDVRIGRQFLSPGPGFGGSCFPSQVRALPQLASQLGVETPVMSAVWRSNLGHAGWLVAAVASALGRELEGARVALLGLTFKAGTDDLRESPALELARYLGARGARLALYDPSGADAGARLLAAGSVSAEAREDAVAACAGADAIVVATEWPEFREIDWSAVASITQGRLIADARGVVDVPKATAAGFDVLVHGVVQRGETPID
jgi:UDPglucose 6-dehydrogenase